MQHLRLKEVVIARFIIYTLLMLLRLSIRLLECCFWSLGTPQSVLDLRLPVIKQCTWDGSHGQGKKALSVLNFMIKALRPSSLSAVQALVHISAVQSLVFHFINLFCSPLSYYMLEESVCFLTLAVGEIKGKCQRMLFKLSIAKHTIVRCRMSSDLQGNHDINHQPCIGGHFLPNPGYIIYKL